MRTKKFSQILIVMVIGLIYSNIANADGLTFLMVAKSQTDGNFITAYKAAKQEAEKFNDKVLFAGSEGKAHFRTQDFSINNALQFKIDGIAISVLNDRFLAKNSFVEIKKRNIPVITFDSDFTHNKQLRTAYVGTNNEEFGYILGTEAKRLKPGGGVVALLSGVKTATNLNNRILGVQRALSGGREFEGRLQGENGWAEHPRTPWYCMDDYERAVQQLTTSLDDNQTDVIISVGWWSQMSEYYEKEVVPYKKKYLDTKKKIIISADATPKQIELLEKGLSHVNVGQDFAKMGVLSYSLLKKLVNGEKIPEYNHTPGKVFRSRH